MPALSRLETHAQLLGMASGVGTCASVQKKIGIVFQIVSLRWVRYSLCDRRLEEVGARKKRLLHRLGAICLPLYFKIAHVFSAFPSSMS